jgi:catechol 2,3-dioxygenase-like lactoylglutathione lyase family enzyme
MLLDGINHVALLTTDTDRLVDFYGEVFGATVFAQQQEEPGMTLTFIDIGPATQLNVFQMDGNEQPHGPMFGRGPIDHLGLQASSKEAFDTIRTRLMERGATDGFVTDFGQSLSVFFRDPDGLECEVCLHIPGARSEDIKGPGNPAAGYDQPTPS